MQVTDQHQTSKGAWKEGLPDLRIPGEAPADEWWLFIHCVLCLRRTTDGFVFLRGCFMMSFSTSFKLPQTPAQALYFDAKRKPLPPFANPV